MKRLFWEKPLPDVASLQALLKLPGPMRAQPTKADFW
jgi:hypothetical protein